MKRFSTGNVVSAKGFIGKDLYVITETDDRRVVMIPFDAKNCTVVVIKEKTSYHVDCSCVFFDEMEAKYSDPDPDCKKCEGTGSIEKFHMCWDDLKIEANTIKDYIVTSMMKAFKGLGYDKEE